MPRQRSQPSSSPPRLTVSSSWPRSSNHTTATTLNTTSPNSTPSPTPSSVTNVYAASMTSPSTTSTYITMPMLYFSATNWPPSQTTTSLPSTSSGSAIFATKTTKRSTPSSNSTKPSVTTFLFNSLRPEPSSRTNNTTNVSLYSSCHSTILTAIARWKAVEPF